MACPTCRILHKLAIGETVPEALAADLALELRGRELQVPGVTLCEAAKDYISREILTKILHDTEEHIDFLEKQQDLLAALGVQNYLQSAMGDLIDDGGEATGG